MITTTICPIVHILLNQRRRNSISCEITCSVEVLLVYLVLNAILESFHRSSYKNNNSAVDNSNYFSSRTSFSSRTILPVEGMDMCRKSAPSYNQQWISVRKCCVMKLPRAFESWHQGCFHSPLHLFNIRALCVALYFSSDSRQGNYKLQQTEKEGGGGNHTPWVKR